MNVDVIHGNFPINLLQMLILMNYLNVINMEQMNLIIKFLMLFYLKLLSIGMYYLFRFEILRYKKAFFQTSKMLYASVKISSLFFC